MDSNKIFYKMVLIRETQRKIEKLFEKGLLSGTSHGCIGQQSIPACVLDNINYEKDYILGNHRSHGHFLSLFENPYLLISELMGLKSGMNSGLGGSQHLNYYNFYTNGITGGMVPIANGFAFRQKCFSNQDIVIVFFGDGAFCQGYVLESLNIASLYSLPILFILENNHYAMSNPISKSISGTIKKRVQSFDIMYKNCIAIDVEQIYQISQECIDIVRKDRVPVFVQFQTHRFSGHSKSDDRSYITKQEDELWKLQDPLINLEKKLSKFDVEKIYKSVNDLIRETMERIESESLLV